MMKFEVKNRYADEVQFVADIECDKDASYGTKLGLAVKWAIENDANLRWADLQDVDLQYADLRRADLRGADLYGADLCKANLQDANLQGANLRYVNLKRADLQGADLQDVDLQYANLRWADLRGANLQGADLRYYKTDLYDCYITSETMQIGCENHSWDDWMSFDDKRILEMDGKDALRWWRENKPVLLAIRKTLKGKNDETF